MLEDQITELPDQAASFGWAQSRPWPALKGPAGRLDGTVNIFLVALRRLRNHLAVAGFSTGNVLP
jgi:hypothetical protein